MNTNITIAQFELQNSWFLSSLMNISEEESNEQFADNLNPIKWVAGHILNTRMSLLTLLSGKAQEPNYGKYFGKGTSNKIDYSFPTLDEIKAKWGSVSTELRGCLEAISPEKLSTAPPFQTSIPNNTVYGLIAYMVIHEAQHIGQLSVLRKLLGKASMSMAR